MNPVQLPIMKNWQDHQALARDLYEREFRDLAVEEFGRNGQAQGGIDILIRSSNSSKIIGVQCKLVSRLSPGDLCAAYTESLSCPIKLTEFWMFVALPRDTKLQTESVDISRTGPILCKVESWDEAASRIQNHADLLKTYYPRMGWAKAASANSVVLFLNMPESYVEVLITHIPEKTYHYGGLLFVSDLQRRYLGITTCIGEPPPYRLGEVFPEYEAFFLQKWINQFNTPDEILELAIGGHAIKASAEFHDEWCERLLARQDLANLDDNSDE
jgi:hypothetical protein